MLTANVLCLKKKKKRTYSLATASVCKGYGASSSKMERSRGSPVTMMQITEDTPPDMLAGAMDLTVHLPNGSAVRMSVERSTPMMDLLVQITTANHLQLSTHTLQALGMAPSSEHSDRILPFKPNTPIGALDTQHIRVLPKGRTLPAPKYTAPGHQPFESTFRLKVHLPRNQLYVTRVSRNVLLEDIMKKVCEEKNLDPVKYEFKHPGNLDQVLDPKLTLSDYQITEIYVVVKGTTNLNQAFSAADIMVLRKEEERKQMHTKTGGGVFNLIFKRGKSSMGSGSVSSENRSISPTHSDDSRSVTPPAVQASPIVAPPKKDPPPDRPKPPQRKRRPAPKPPQIQVAGVTNENSAENNSSVVSNEEPSNNSSENGLTICHSRNSSDSSGYHEASILSDHCANTSLPRARPKSAFVGDQEPLQSTSNLSKMSEHSRSTTSLMAGRKKKAAPPPPPVPVSPASSVVAQSEKPSPLVASQSDISTHKESSEVLETTITPIINPVPKPRSRTKAPQAPPRPRPSSEIFTSNEEYSLSGGSSRISSNEDLLKKVENDIKEKLGIKEDESKTTLNRNVVESVLKETLGDHVKIASKEFVTTDQTEDNTLELELRRPIIEENETLHIQSSTGLSIKPEYITQQTLENRSKHISQESPRTNLIEADIQRPISKENPTANITDSSTNIVSKKESITKETLENHVKNISVQTPSATGVEFEVELRRPVLKEKVIDNLEDKESTSDFSSKAESASHTSLEVQRKDAKDTRLEFHLGPTHEQPQTKKDQDASIILSSKLNRQNEDFSVEEMLTSLEVVNSFSQDKEPEKGGIKSEGKLVKTEESVIGPPPVAVFNVQKSVIANIFTSEEFLKESRPPSIVGVIPKTPQENKKQVSDMDSFGRKRGQLSKALQMDDPETGSISSKQSGENKSSRDSVSSALDALDDEIADLDENMFTGSLSKGSVQRKPEVFNHIFGMPEYDTETENRFHRNISVASLHSVSSLNDTVMKKWDNTEQLNSTSLNYYGVRNKWVAGDASDTESPVQTPRDSIPQFPLDNSTPVKTQSEEKSLESTDSGIAQDTPSHREKDEEFGFHTPPPPPILDDIYQEIPTPKIKDGLTPSTNAGKEQLTTNISTSNTSEDKSVVVLNKSVVTEVLSTKTEISVKPKVDPQVIRTSISPSVSGPPQISLDHKKQEPPRSIVNPKANSAETELVDIDWHYQLPSPPKAFRDSNPGHLILTEINSVTDFKDSVVTSPELFEKLKSLEDTQSEKDTLKSDVTSIASEEPLNMLSLEHLEKRKSLVYNRELATSLKVTDNVETSTDATDNFTSSITSFQSTYDDMNKAAPVQQTQPRKPARTTVSSSHHNTLPNFKISTYDVPKQNITVFEDETISSNTHVTSNLTRNKLGRSMDNISLVKRLGEESGNNERDYKFYRPQTANFGPLSTMSRSESFSTDLRLPSKPVSRSKSTLTINKLPVNKMDETENSISRSNSLFDVSGLQSLEVMKLIQNKLNTPTGSMENLSYRDKTHNTYVPQKLLTQEEVAEPEQPTVPETQPVEEKPQPPSPQPVKKYYYRGPPAVNMTTWSERPKVPVSVKEDEDYKLGNVNVSSKLIVNTTNNNITSNNSIEIRNNGFGKSNSHFNEPENRSVSVNVNGTDQFSQPTNNVVIKIGGSNSNNYQKNMENQRFLGPTAYRKPFSNINRNGSSITPTPRPHSIALPSDFDISRVPVVRSVEFKKPFKDFHGSNTSITHINQGSDDFKSLHNNFDTSDSFADKFRSTENLKSVERLESDSNKRVFRVGSFKPSENHSNPVIRGFRPERDVNHRLSWNPSSTYNTLPSKPKMEREYSTNQHVPFSQSTLKRTASSKIYSADQNYNDISKPVVKPDNSFIEDNSYSSLPSIIPRKMNTVPPPPPQMPKIALKRVSPQVKSQASPVDPRDMLLDSIRNFGGKKGLRAVK